MSISLPALDLPQKCGPEHCYIYILTIEYLILSDIKKFIINSKNNMIMHCVILFLSLSVVNEANVCMNNVTHTGEMPISGIVSVRNRFMYHKDNQSCYLWKENPNLCNICDKYLLPIMCQPFKLNFLNEYFILSYKNIYYTNHFQNLHI